MSLVAHGLVHSWPSLPLRLFGLAHILAEHHNAETGECFPAISTLAKRGETSERSIQRALQELEDRGVISRAADYGDSGRQQSNNYVFHAHAGVTSTSPPPDTSVTLPPDTSVTPMLISNKESNTILADSCATPQVSCHPPLSREDSKGRLNGCPYAEIRRLWAEICPTLPQPLSVENWTDARKAQLRARWGNQLPSLSHWQTTFEMVAASDFLTGQAHNPKRKPFRCTLWWITKPENLSKLYEGDYDNA